MMLANGVVACRRGSGLGLIRAGRASHTMESRSCSNEGGAVVVAGSRGAGSKGWLEGWFDSGRESFHRMESSNDEKEGK